MQPQTRKVGTMRKLLFLSAAIAIVGHPALAQSFESPTFDNSAQVTQIGNDNNARVAQTIDGIINGQGSAEISQNGETFGRHEFLGRNK